MTRRKYARTPALPPMSRKPALPPIVRRCPSGEYEVLQDGLKLTGGLDSFEEGEQWIMDNVK